MKKYFSIAVLVAVVFLLAACGEQSGVAGDQSDAGSMAFSLDLNPLLTTASMKLGAPSAAPIITAATATVSRNGYEAVVKDLTVTNNIATGRIDNLDPGYWHVEVAIYENTALLYSGTSDVNVIAGTVSYCNILFTPFEPAPTTGSIMITAGLNPMPGYSIINQAVSDILFDAAGAQLYILDSSAKIIGIYNADTLIRTRDIPVPSAPLSVALDYSRTGIYLGFTSGHIHRLDIATGEDVLVADVLMQVEKMVTLNNNFLMVSGPGSWDTDLKIVNTSTGQVVSTITLFYSLTDLIYNPAAKTVYSHHTGVSPTDIHFIKVNDVTGAILSEGDSVYHGDYSFGLPLRIINNGTRIATSSGNMFSSAELNANDLRYNGNLGYSYIDLSSDDPRGKLYLLNNSGIQKLLIMNHDSYFLDFTVELSGTPYRIFNTSGTIIVFSTKDGNFYGKTFAKVDLGL